MRILFLLLLCFTGFVLGHEGHEAAESVLEGRPATWTQWIGSFHLIFLHFPIALINMLAVSELLGYLYRRSEFESVSRFLLISAAFLTPPTALLGLVYSYSVSYEGFMETLLWWHRGLGVFTAILVVILALLRDRVSKAYYAGLILLFVMVNATAFFGGGMTFGPFQMLPP